MRSSRSYPRVTVFALVAATLVAAGGIGAGWFVVRPRPVRPAVPVPPRRSRRLPATSPVSLASRAGRPVEADGFVPAGDSNGQGREVPLTEEWAAAREEAEAALSRLDAGAAEAALSRLEDLGFAGAEMDSLRTRLSGLEKRLPGGCFRAGERTAWKVNGVTFRFRCIPGGKDVLGSPPDEPCRGPDERQWLAEFMHGFWIGETEVTRRQWMAVMGDDPSGFPDCPDCPVEMVSWDEAREFVRRLNQVVKGAGFRLPWEAEWEYACRAGEDGPFGASCPDFSEENCRGFVSCLDGIGWYDPRNGNSEGRTHRVGLLAANRWGLRDCHGNVWEWCADWYGDYPSGRATDWHGPSTGVYHVLRGGSWYDNAGLLRVATRVWPLPGYRGRTTGLRLVRDVPARVQVVP